MFVIGARALDPVTHQFLSSDPLLPAAGSNGATSGYTLLVARPRQLGRPHRDAPHLPRRIRSLPSSKRQRHLPQSLVDAIREDPWGTLAIGALIVTASVVGGPVGASIAIGLVTSSAIGLATGTFDPTTVAVSGAFGIIPGGNTVRNAVVIGGASGAGETVVSSYLNGNGMPSGQDLVIGTVAGGVVGGGTRVIGDILPSGSTARTSHAPDAPPARADSRSEFWWYAHDLPWNQQCCRVGAFTQTLDSS